MPKAFDPIGAANFDFPIGSENDVLAPANIREKKAKDAWLKIMNARHLRHLLRECYRREGVNHKDNCKEFAQAYFEAIQQPMFTGGAGALKANAANRQKHQAESEH
ncbi:hypothetical protein GUITHDRAFT_153600 [Guillardia theta CCMP2712]|uniref:Uncharacterized protein n=1 Tax=Guillardia theta (strain CCMP2712) TaxID=905079 RepID=L1J2M0_GUITC|nr:hypothetical protein GUITHDRAFT_153600 [Guillardia theta CCMP2712]EKX42379.1 hypothetical protein GUITHDRAFT_153600 [Guillardia theta CCMP2712]|eukprot:XP_005829359.1 hypothetical protein GUITHDRAFT_153600 [Guillardia theta CCMP2712]